MLSKVWMGIFDHDHLYLRYLELVLDKRFWSDQFKVYLCHEHVFLFVYISFHFRIRTTQSTNIEFDWLK